MAGFIYIMSNKSFDERLKIVKSTKDPTGDRVVELNSSTSLPEKFKVEYYCYVDRQDDLELRVHENLHSLRPNKKREFFTLELQSAVNVIRTLAKEFGGVIHEYFADPEQPSEPEIADENVSKSPTSNLKDKYPSAFVACEYNETVKLIYDELSRRPGNGAEYFLSRLEEDPAINHSDLEVLL